MRHATSNDNFKVETTIYPFPVTANEKRISAGENAFVTWFLVSDGILTVYTWDFLFLSNSMTPCRSSWGFP